MCGPVNLTTLTGDPYRVLESKGAPQNCAYFVSRPNFQIRISNPSDALRSSACWQGTNEMVSGAFVFEAPSILIFYYWDSKTPGAPPIYVFVDIPMIANYSWQNFSEQARDAALLEICPPNFGQIYHPEMGNWVQLNFDADQGVDYDSVINNLFGGAGGSGRSRAGFEGMNKTVKAQSMEPFKLRNIVLDPEAEKLLKPVRGAWNKIDGYFRPIIGPLDAKWGLLKLLEDGANKLGESDFSGETARDIAELAKLARENAPSQEGAEFGRYAEELDEATAAAAEGDKKKAKKILKDLAKQLSKDRRNVEKELKPFIEPRQAVLDAFEEWEYVVAGERMGKFVKSYPDESARDSLKLLLEDYKKAARSFQDHLEKLKSREARPLDEETLIEAVPVEAGEQISFFMSVTGGKHDLEAGFRTRWKVIFEHEFVPAGPDGTVDKDTPPLEKWVPVLISADDLLAQGFKKAIVESDERTWFVASARRDDGAEIHLRHFTERAGVVETEVPLAELRDKYNVRWVLALLPNRGRLLIPPQSDKFLSTSKFIDGESIALTVTGFTFTAGGTVPEWLFTNTKKEEAIELRHVMAPGVYRAKMVLVDVLGENPKERVLIMPDVYFRILPLSSDPE